MKKLSINPFSKSSIEILKAEIDKMEEEVRNSYHEAVDETMNEGLEVVKNNASNLVHYVDSSQSDVVDGNFVKAGRNTKNTRSFKIINNTEEATYSEFGTGIVGANSPHRLAGDRGWEYDVNGHSHNGWTFLSRYDDIPIHTIGVRASHFMYNSIPQIEDTLKRKLKEKLKGKGY